MEPKDIAPVQIANYFFGRLTSSSGIDCPFELEETPQRADCGFVRLIAEYSLNVL
jgi:hypothetical protein